MTTVGYGDITPHTAIAKVVACAVMLVGIGFFALFTGAIAQRFLAAEADRFQEELAAAESAEVEALDELLAIAERVRKLENRLRKQVDARPSTGQRN
jgi:voltage-gated potassium channel